MGDAARPEAGFWTVIGKIVVASWLMAVTLRLAHGLLEPWFGIGGLRYLALLLLVAAGVASYGFFGQLLGAFRLSAFKQALRRNN